MINDERRAEIKARYAKGYLVSRERGIGLIDALSQAGVGQYVYERLGKSANIALDHNARMLAMLKRFVERAERVKTCKCLPESGCIESVLLSEGQAIITEVTEYNANMLAAIAKYDQ